jgi:hypothetical protein
LGHERGRNDDVHDDFSSEFVAVKRNAPGLSRGVVVVG